MADRIIKGDSGNDVIIQNNDGSRKIEVTNSGDVEVTGDFKATTVKATNLKANDGTAGLVVADSTGRVQVAEKIETDDIIEKTSAHGVEIDGLLIKDSALNTGSIGDDVNFSNKYYLQLTLGAAFTLGSGGSYINTTGTSSPYFTNSGDNTNILPTDTNNIKLIRKGIYLISFNVTSFQHSSTYSAQIDCEILGGTSVNPTSVIAENRTQIANTVSVADYGSGTACFVGERDANSFVRFFCEGFTTDDVSLNTQTSVSIVLIRPIA